jgi:hypothetical protein
VVLLLVFLALLAVVASFGAGYAVAVARTRVVEMEGLPDAPDLERLETEPTRVAFTRLAAEGTADWRFAMEDLGGRMRAAGVRLIVFAHGSFVGDDPLAIARSIEEAVPVLPDLVRALRSFTRTQVSRFLGDLSNFTREYIDALGAATHVDAIEFTWSGENHHAARVQEAARLARTLALYGGGSLGPRDRVLLVGHSHGGQLFALLSQLVARSRGYEQLVDAARARGEDVVALEDHLARLRRCTIDVATFGTPPRYAWARGSGFRLLHVVNHRGAAPRAASLRGLLHTRQGDYVQQLGAPGSDWLAPSAKDRAVNERLDVELGAGANFRAWLHHVARGLRVATHGHTVLVDYGDDARVLPNFWATGFGHAAYTRRESMLFHLRLVADHFYPPGEGLPKPTDKAPGVRGWIAPGRLLLPRRRPPSIPDV